MWISPEILEELQYTVGNIFDTIARPRLQQKTSYDDTVSCFFPILLCLPCASVEKIDRNSYFTVQPLGSEVPNFALKMHLT